MVFGICGTHQQPKDIGQNLGTYYTHLMWRTQWERIEDVCLMHERVIIAGMSEKKMGRLPNHTAISIGMKAMVTWNISTDADLANGARGEVVDIVLNQWEDPSMVEGTNVLLKYPPIMMLIKPVNKSKIKFPGLSAGLIPISPAESTFSIKLPLAAKTTITRRWIALTASYSLTNYRSHTRSNDQICCC